MKIYAEYRITVETTDQDAINNGDDDLDALCEEVEKRLACLETDFIILVHHCETPSQIQITSID